MMQRAKDTYFEQILITVNGMKIPDIEFDKGHLKTSTLSIKDQNNDVSFDVDPAHNSFILTVKHLEVSFHSDDLKYMIWFVPATGWVKVHMKNVHMSVGIQMSTQTVNGKKAVGFAISSTKMNIDDDDLELDIGGGVITTVADAII
jgi:hypothetical protein